MIPVGLVLPSFRMDAGTALDTAVRAEEAGLDGVFVYDHLFPMGRPERPALPCLPLLGAVAATTSRIALGPLVARVGVVPDAVLVNQLATLSRMAGPRLVAALGTGDAKSRPEHEAFGLALAPVSQRLASLAWCCRSLRQRGVTTWVGGASPAVGAVAAAEADAWNVWDVEPARLATLVAGHGGPVTWAGPPPPGDLGAHLSDLGEAGARWCVYAPPPSVDWPAQVARMGEARTA